MRQKTHEVRMPTADNVIHIKIDISTIPSRDRKYGRLKNKAQRFEDRRYKKPKYKKNYLED